MDPERSDESKQASEPTAQQINDLFDSAEFAAAVGLADFKRFLDHVPIAIVVSKVLHGDQRIVYTNKAFEVLTGRRIADVRGRGWSILDAFRHEDDAQIVLSQALLRDEDCVGTFQLNEPKLVLVEVYAGVIQSEDGEEKYRIVALVDVTERERSQREEFAREIRDKDLLLKEIQHRVKNNLQLITALIRLQARTERNGDKGSLDRLAGRIESMQFLYQALSATPVGQDIDLGQYLSQIASAVMRTHASEGIRLDVKVESAPVSINIAMPIGLAINELLTNAFKYAFTGRDSGVITLECLRQDSDLYRVIVSDDGVGFPPGVTWPGDGKLGALIMQTLCENAKTELDVESAPGAGARVTIRFVYDALTARAA